MALAQTVKSRALELGFDRVAIGPAGPPPHAAAFEHWLDTGRAGTMDYLAETRAARLDPARLLPGCRSVIAVALNYARADEPEWRGVARYARSADYHDTMRPRLHALRDHVSAAAGAQSRASLDTSAVLERDLAAAAGLGWIGKNTNLITPGLGSYYFIGIVLTTAVLAADDPMPDRCGTCTACLDACPTAAFDAPYALDARRCIAYLTIEHRGPIAEEFHALMGEWLFGCDVCQEVCPWNRHAPVARETVPATPPPAPEALVAMTDDEFRQRFRGSPLKRARREGLARNAAIVLANRWYDLCSKSRQTRPVREKESIDMADNKDQNKDAQSGEPVQLDKEQDQQHQDGRQQGGQQQGNQAGGQEQGAKHEGGQRR
jgi:epoxyqueuosine reductase